MVVAAYRRFRRYRLQHPKSNDLDCVCDHQFVDLIRHLLGYCHSNRYVEHIGRHLLGLGVRNGNISCCRGAEASVSLRDGVYRRKRHHVRLGRAVDQVEGGSKPGRNFPSGNPVWGGSSGASGSGETVSVAFNTLSTSKADMKTVTVTCGTSSITANVVVVDVTPTLTPVDNFEGRDLDAYGVCEYINLTCPITPSDVTEYDLGGITWELESGGGSLSGTTYQCSDTSDGPPFVLRASLYGLQSYMKWKYPPGPPKDVVAPNAHLTERDMATGLWHIKNKVGVKFKAFFYSKSDKAVSFAQIEVREGTSSAAVASGFMDTVLNLDGTYHTPSSGFFSLNNLTAGKGYKWNAIDTTGFGENDSKYDAPYTAGTFVWDIYMMYRKKGDTGNGFQYAAVTSTKTSNMAGRGSAAKGQAGPYSKNAGDNSNTGYITPDP